MAGETGKSVKKHFANIQLRPNVLGLAATL
jgi:hypothetical protein